jgi:hypothetical protein
MELYILDDELRRITVIDKFESLIWTERFQSFGDFELVINYTQSLQTILQQGTKVIVNKSHRIMVIDQVENVTDNDGKKYLNVKGTSLEKFLRDRVATSALANSTSTPKGEAFINILGDFASTYINDLVTGDEVFFTTNGHLPGRKLKNPDNPNQDIVISGFNFTDDYFRFNQHNLVTGDKVYFKTTGTLPSPLVQGTLYYVIVLDSDLLKLATNKTNAFNGTAINLTGSPNASSGTHNIYLALNSYTPYYIVATSTYTFKLALTYEDAMAAVPNTEVVYSGTGTHQLNHVNRGKFRVTGTRASIPQTIFTRFCVDPDTVLESTDVLPLYESGSLYPTDNIPVDTTILRLDINTSTVYDVIKELCEAWGLGFRITRYYENKKFYFNIYSGIDRTTLQTTYPVVIFDKNLESLVNEREFVSSRNYKNVAYVFAPNGFKKVYSDMTTSNTTGFDKHALVVDASDIETLSGITLDVQLEQRGREALSQHRTLVAFDGEINNKNNYIYDLHYSLGDLVEVRNSDGFSEIKRVTEQIFTDDAEGEKSYPTLSSEITVTPNSWLYYNSQATWNTTSDTLLWSSSTLI